ncbi:hypothetical protein PM082_016766 [Marasmius tenuissimus]|nr:hypothetical protein PM082_016766 [Marasmius tenuissimus]
MNFSLSIEDTPVSSISLSRSVARSRISPLFFALNSQLPQAIPSDSTLWLSLNANYNQASYTTFLEFSVDYGLPPTVDVMLGADFYDKCRTNMPLLAAVYSDESPAGHTSNVATTPFSVLSSFLNALLYIEVLYRNRCFRCVSKKHDNHAITYSLLPLNISSLQLLFHSTHSLPSIPRWCSGVAPTMYLPPRLCPGVGLT